MSSSKIIAIAIAATGLAGLAYLLLGGADTGPDVATDGRASVPAVTTRPPNPDKPAPRKERVGPDGRPISTKGRELRRQGLPERPVPGSPMDETTWEQERAKADAEWKAGMNEATALWTGSKELSTDQEARIVDAITQFTEQVDATRKQLKSGALSPADTRAQMGALRAQMAEDSLEILGRAQSDELRDYLGEKIVGGGW